MIIIIIILALLRRETETAENKEEEEGEMEETAGRFMGDTGRRKREIGVNREKGRGC